MTHNYEKPFGPFERAMARRPARECRHGRSLNPALNGPCEHCAEDAKVLEEGNSMKIADRVWCDACEHCDACACPCCNPPDEEEKVTAICKHAWPGETIQVVPCPHCAEDVKIMEERIEAVVVEVLSAVDHGAGYNADNLRDALRSLVREVRRG